MRAGRRGDGDGRAAVGRPGAIWPSFGAGQQVDEARRQPEVRRTTSNYKHLTRNPGTQPDDEWSLACVPADGPFLNVLFRVGSRTRAPSEPL